MTFLAFVSLMPQTAKAQVCDTLFEVITTLRPPTFGFPTVWDAKYGSKDHMVQLSSGVPQEGGTVMAIGRRLSKESFQPENIVMVELNRRGRALKEEMTKAKDAEVPVKMIQIGNEFIAVSNIRGGTKLEQKWIRLSWYDRDGKYKREKIIKDPVFNFEAKGLIESVEAKGFITVIHGTNRADETDQNGILMRFNTGGELMWRRAYRPGIPNVLNSVVPVDERSYIAAGRIILDDGRMAGWAMKLGYDGSIHWQRTYPRGGFSVFDHVDLDVGGTVEGHNFILSGASSPLDDGPDAAWVMEIDAQGEPQWQRYYRRPDYALYGNWVRVEDDGRIVVMMNAEATDDGGGHDHVRILTLSPRGVLIQDESYTEGLQANATDYVPGWNGERIFTSIIEDDMGQSGEEEIPINVIGLIDNPEVAEAEEEPLEPVQKGWVFVATALDFYEDPCGGQRP